MDIRGKSNIVLIGMPGAGKSTVGVLLAKRTARDFLDTDLLIQSRHGRALQEIVDEHGAHGLRGVEGELLSGLDVTRHVIATGGSAVYSEEAMARLKRDGVVVYLNVPFSVIERRLTDHASRGLAKGPEQGLADLYAEREPLYRRFADLTVHCDGLAPDAVCRAILEALGYPA